MSLAHYTSAVHQRMNTAVESPEFDSTQRALLRATLRRFQGCADPSDVAQPLALVYLLLRSYDRRPDEQAEWIGAAGMFYVCSLDLFDDVQDADLAGKPHETVGAPIATNNALALLFLCLDCLRRGLALEPDLERRLAYLAVLNHTSLIAVGAQHGDLLGTAGAQSPDEVLALHRGKTSSVALLMELGALLGGCSPDRVECYRRTGEHLACLAQIVDDLRDIYAKDESPDLNGDKMTYPVACFVQGASTRAKRRLGALKRRLPESLPAIRELLHEAGAVDQCAAALECLRTQIHHELAATGEASAYHRLMLAVVDAVCQGVYEPDPIPETEALFEPRGPFTQAVQKALRDVADALSAFGLPPAPRVVPWHLPHFNYDPERRTIFYPDVDGLPDEVLPFHQSLFGARDFAETSAILMDQLPFVLAHEFVHFLRDAEGRLSQDHWHEEYVANRLALAYVTQFAPGVRESGLSLSRRLLRGSAVNAHTEIAAILARCKQQGEPRGYEVNAEVAALVHAKMLLQLAKHPSDLAAQLRSDLALSEVVAAE